jgi:Protein kinase domain/Domain of Unknown Function (DUF1080)
MKASESGHPTDETLCAYGLGKLDDILAEAINQHLESCTDCRNRIATMSADSFLGRAREAKGAVSSTFGASQTGGTGSVERSSSPPGKETMPPGLADHPDYEIKKELGRGGMGVVYLAHNRLLGRDEVLKVMGRQIMERPGVLDRFLREIRVVANLRHPNIVTAYSAVRLGENIMLAMEYVEGLDLSKMVKAKGPLPVANACNFVYQSALGLQHAHEEGLIHRDIKPGNLMLSRNGDKATIKVLDFGLAKVTREQKVDGALTHEGQALGTPDFIAPEQILDATSADIRADIYSLGCTLYYLLSGQPPFRANSLYDMFQAHISRDADLLNFVRPEVPAELAALVAKLMAKDPARRFQSPKELSHALKPFFKAGGVSFGRSQSEIDRTTAGWNPVPVRAVPAQPPADAAGAIVRPRNAAEPTAPDPVWEGLIEFKEVERSSNAVIPRRTAAAGTVWWPPWLTWPAIVAGSLSGLIALGVIIYVNVAKVRPTIAAEEKPVNIRAEQEKEGDGNAKTNEVAPANPARNVMGDKPAAEPARWVSLFNGEDLAGWNVGGDPANQWKVDNGVIVGTGFKGWSLLRTNRADFANFHLRVETKPVEGWDGAVDFRYTFSGGTARTYFVAVGGTQKAEPGTGDLGRLNGGSGRQYIARARPVSAVRPGEWFTMEVIVVGDSLTVIVAGEEVINVKDTDRSISSGSIALWCPRDSTAVFRKIELRQLPPSPEPGESAGGNASTGDSIR